MKTDTHDLVAIEQTAECVVKIQLDVVVQSSPTSNDNIHLPAYVLRNSSVTTVKIGTHELFTFEQNKSE